ncbi:carboxymuconolactone decarboxylase family protein [Numidum massiliense]|uniref:carboxymuconolactone decarboxylase family protein n=1 Tax=Numidum massiliense TaxID=1522315 RepID=UPI0006D53C46|nr:carboxymuconolactone decarboxylase family protein [Numidum massiliense]
MEAESSMIKENWVGLALQDYKVGLGRLQEQSPHLVDSFNHFTDTCFQAGAVDAKTKQLMALAISVVANSEYCTIYHVQGALEHGATEEEILEAVGVATAFGGGPAIAQGVTLVQDAVQEIQQRDGKLQDGNARGNVH